MGNKAGRYDLSHELRSACDKGKLDIVKEILESGEVDVNAGDQFGITPLHEACLEGHLHIAKYLVSKGARVNVQSDDGDTSLHMAITGAYTPLISFLIQCDPGVLHIASNRGLTPLHLAASANMKRVIIQLLNAGANINAVYVTFLLPGSLPLSLSPWRSLRHLSLLTPDVTPYPHCVYYYHSTKAGETPRDMITQENVRLEYDAHINFMRQVGTPVASGTHLPNQQTSPGGASRRDKNKSDHSNRNSTRSTGKKKKKGGSSSSKQKGEGAPLLGSDGPVEDPVRAMPSRPSHSRGPPPPPQQQQQQQRHVQRPDSTHTTHTTTTTTTTTTDHVALTVSDLSSSDGEDDRLGPADLARLASQPADMGRITRGTNNNTDDDEDIDTVAIDGDNDDEREHLSQLLTLLTQVDDIMSHPKTLQHMHGDDMANLKEFYEEQLGKIEVEMSVRSQLGGGQSTLPDIMSL